MHNNCQKRRWQWLCELELREGFGNDPVLTAHSRRSGQEIQQRHYAVRLWTVTTQSPAFVYVSAGLDNREMLGTRERVACSTGRCHGISTGIQITNTRCAVWQHRQEGGTAGMMTRTKCEKLQAGIPLIWRHSAMSLQNTDTNCRKCLQHTLKCDLYGTMVCKAERQVQQETGDRNFELEREECAAEQSRLAAIHNESKSLCRICPTQSEVHGEAENTTYMQGRGGQNKFHITRTYMSMPTRNGTKLEDGF